MSDEGRGCLNVRRDFRPLLSENVRKVRSPLLKNATPPMTRLLVSVRNADEAIAAIKGGADIIDVKEPDHGALGCAAPPVIRKIAAAIRAFGKVETPLSLALGELSEWPEGGLSGVRDTILTVRPHYLKIGLAATFDTRQPESWSSEWEYVRSTIPGEHSWVAVAYADSKNAVSPHVDLVLNAAIETGCRILLIDTHTKSSSSLLDWLSLRELTSIRQLTEQHGIKLALAGRVTLGILDSVLQIQPDIVAIRGAACDQGQRTASISQILVREFRDAISGFESRRLPLMR